MWPFRRRHEETLNEQLLREAGLDGSQPIDAAPAPPSGAGPLQGCVPVLSPFGKWPAPAPFDIATTVHAAGVPGSLVEFAALPSGDLVVDREDGDADLSPLANAVRRSLLPPYRAYGRHEEGDLWAITANAIHVLQFTFEGGDEIELVMRGGATQLTVDDEPTAGTVPELEDQGRAVGADYVVHAERLDFDLWEVKADAL